MGVAPGICRIGVSPTAPLACLNGVAMGFGVTIWCREAGPDNEAGASSSTRSGLSPPSRADCVSVRIRAFRTSFAT